MKGTVFGFNVAEPYKSPVWGINRSISQSLTALLRGWINLTGRLRQLFKTDIDHLNGKAGLQPMAMDLVERHFTSALGQYHLQQRVIKVKELQI